MKRYTLFVVLGLILTAGVFALLTNLLAVKTYKVEKVRRGPAIASVYATGYVEARERRSLRPPRVGIVDKIHVKEGDEVRAGAPLITLRDSARDARRSAAEVTLRNVEEKLADKSSFLKSWDARIEEAKQNYDQALDRARRLRAQVERGGASKDAAEEAESRAAALSERYRQLQMDASQTVSDLQAERTRARSELDMILAQERDDTIKSPIDGVVLAVHVEEGEFADLQRELVKVGDVRELIIEAEVNEDDIPRVRVGKEAMVRLAGNDEVLVKAVVYEILPDADRATKSYTVRLNFKDASFIKDTARTGLAGTTLLQEDAKPFSGMTAELGIVTETIDNALVFRRSALTINKTVFVVENGIARERKVQVGVQNFEYCQAKSGLNENDLVIIAEVGTVRDGMRVGTRE